MGERVGMSMGSSLCESGVRLWRGVIVVVNVATGVATVVVVIVIFLLLLLLP